MLVYLNGGVVLGLDLRNVGHHCLVHGRNGDHTRHRHRIRCCERPIRLDSKNVFHRSRDALPFLSSTNLMTFPVALFGITDREIVILAIHQAMTLQTENEIRSLIGCEFFLNQQESYLLYSIKRSHFINLLEMECNI